MSEAAGAARLPAMADRPPSRSSFDDAWYLAAFVLCALATLAPLWIGKYLPMVDLPQHAAQVFIWQHFDDPRFKFHQHFEIAPLTPYVLGYAIARLFAMFLPAVLAMKATVTLATLALPMSVHFMIARTGGDRFWTLLGFPLAFGVNFYWGFISFLIATPIVIVFITLAQDYSEHPNLRLAVALGALALLLCFAHGLAIGVAGPTAALLILSRARGLRAAVLRLLPLVAPGLVALACVLFLRGQRDSQGPSLWSFAPWYRLGELPGSLIDYPDGRISGLVGLAMLVALGFCIRLREDWRRFIPFFCFLLAYLLIPMRLLGVWYVYPRFASLAAIFALMAGAPRANSLSRTIGRLVFLCLILGWCSFLTGRFRAFNQEARGLDDLLPHMQADRRVLSLLFDNQSRFIRGNSFLHFPVWYQAEKGGEVGFSFATSPAATVRYKPNAQLRMSAGLEWHPQRFSWSRDSEFDYFVIRSVEDRGPELFRKATEPVVMLAHSGMWWLYAKSALGNVGNPPLK